MPGVTSLKYIIKNLHQFHKNCKKNDFEKITFSLFYFVFDWSRSYSINKFIQIFMSITNVIIHLYWIVMEEKHL